MDQIFSRNKDLPWQAFDDETIIINPESKDSFELNEVGSFIWSRIDGVKSVAKIRDEICAHYDARPEMVDEDLTDLLYEMAKKNLIGEVTS
ncbi:MAG: PqqD family protein [Pseudomonadota bacterium]